MNRKLMWYAISKIQGIEARYLDKIIECFGDIEPVFQLHSGQLKKRLSEAGFPGRMTDKLVRIRDIDYSDEFNALEKQKIGFLTIDDNDFPKRFRYIKHPPYYLYYRGRLPQDSLPSLAIIGARNCSVYGREIALCFSSVLAAAGIQIISGMARGIDGYAHRGALDAGAYTCGVLGFGIDVCYPKEHIRLKQELQQTGGLLSEYALGIPGLQQNFPARNRLIAGLSDAVLVIEAAHRSGTLITVDDALEQGKMVYAVPGRIGDKLSEGCNDIIKDGGKIVTDPTDVLAEFNLKLVQNSNKCLVQKNKIVLETQEKIVYACLDLEPRHIEEIALLTKLSQNDLLVCLMHLEMLGYIRQPVKNYYIRNIRYEDR